MFRDWGQKVLPDQMLDFLSQKTVREKIACFWLKKLKQNRPLYVDILKLNSFLACLLKLQDIKLPA